MAAGMRRPPEITEEEWEFRLSPEVYMCDGEVSAAQADRMFRDWVRRTVAARRGGKEPGGVPSPPALSPLIPLPPRATSHTRTDTVGNYEVRVALVRGTPTARATSVRPLRGQYRVFSASRVFVRPSGGMQFSWDELPPVRVRERADAMLAAMRLGSR